MKIEYDGYHYNVGNRTRPVACSGCIISSTSNLKCPLGPDGQCVLPLDKIYTNCYSDQVFKL